MKNQSYSLMKPGGTRPADMKQLMEVIEKHNARAVFGARHRRKR